MENRKDFLTVSEYAEIKGITPQAVYKQLNNEKHKLNKYLIIVDDKKYIDKAALEDDELNEVKQQFNNEFKQVEQQFNESLIALLQKQIEEKDRQIETLFKQLEEKDKQIETIHNLLNQSQQLQAADKKLLLEKENQKKKGFLRLFKKRGAAEDERNI